MRALRCSLLPLLLFACSTGLQADTAGMQRLGFQDPSLWKELSFHGHTSYRFVHRDGGMVIRAESSNAASALTRKITVDLDTTPYLRWSWRVDGVLNGNDERSKAGDDYPARIYIVRKGGWTVWNTIAVNYVWSNNQPRETSWPSAYAAQSMMVAVRPGPPTGVGWYTERRNVKRDFQRLLGEDVRYVDLIALMTDTDDTGKKAAAWYGDIRFTAD